LHRTPDTSSELAPSKRPDLLDGGEQERGRQAK
jgi:hypothetical protein